MPRITKTEYETLAAFRYAIRQFLRFSEEAAQSAGLTPQQHQALLAIKAAQNKLTIKELAERMQIRHHSAVGLVDRLMAQGLLKREPSRADRRQVYVTLSPQGSRLLERLSSTHKEELRRMLPELRNLIERLSGDQVNGADQS